MFGGFKLAGTGVLENVCSNPYKVLVKIRQGGDRRIAFVNHSSRPHNL